MTSDTVWNGTIPGGTTSSSVARADGLQFLVNSTCTLTGIAFYVPVGETSLSGSSYTAKLYSTTTGLTGSLVLTQAGAGTFIAGAWNWISVNQALAVGTTYVAAVENPDLLQYVHDYWAPGGSQGPMTVGPVTVPSGSTALGGVQQPSGSAGSFPATVNNSWYGIDIEVSTGGSIENGVASLSASAVLAAAATLSRVGGAALSAAASVTPGAVLSRHGATALSAVAALTAAGARKTLGSAPLTAPGSLAAVGLRKANGSLALTAPGSLAGAAFLGRHGAAVLSAVSVVSAREGTPAAVTGTAALSASPSLSCSYLAARITLSANSMFPANGTGTYGPPGDSSTVVVPGVIDGVFDA